MGLAWWCRSTPSQSWGYDTLFGDEAIVVYDGGTGNQLFKIRQTLLSNQKNAVYSCEDKSATVTISGKSPSFTVDLGGSGSGALACRYIGACPFGMIAAQNAGEMACSTSVSSFILSIPDWVEENKDNITQPVQLRAWGGKGHKGTNDSGGCDGGEGGSHGFALTSMLAQDLPDTLNYAYVGNGGSQDKHAGSGSILASVPLSTIPTPDTITNPSSSSLWLVAGGGGAGGEGDEGENDCTGGDGGEGAVAIATSGKAVFGKGGTGGRSGGKGGNTNGQGNGGGRGGSGSGSGGTSGLGGWGGGTHTKWITGGPLIPPTSWSAGSGGGGGYGADGAGGFGGGGGGGEQ